MQGAAAHLLEPRPSGSSAKEPSLCFKCSAECQPWERNSTRNSETLFQGFLVSNLVSSMASAGVRFWIYLGSSY